MNKFNEEVNRILANKIKKRKHKIKKELTKLKFGKKGPRGMPVPVSSPALKTGLPNQEIAQGQTPPSVMP